jgi:hypothetical protein
MFRWFFLLTECKEFQTRVWRPGQPAAKIFEVGPDADQDHFSLYTIVRMLMLDQSGHGLTATV